MITLASIICWGLALAAHALLQPKILRVLKLPSPRRWVLQGVRAVFPFVALYLSCQLDTCCIILSWFGAASVAGVIAALVLTILSVRSQRIASTIA